VPGETGSRSWDRPDGRPTKTIDTAVLEGLRRVRGAG